MGWFRNKYGKVVTNKYSGLKIVFCIPGNSFSGRFLSCWTNLVKVMSSYKINFTNILSNKNKLKQEDLKFYENSLENLLIDNDLGDLFNYKKIKNFITEIY